MWIPNIWKTRPPFASPFTIRFSLGHKLLYNDQRKTQRKSIVNGPCRGGHPNISVRSALSGFRLARASRKSVFGEVFIVGKY